MDELGPFSVPFVTSTGTSEAELLVPNRFFVVVKNGHRQNLYLRE